MKTGIIYMATDTQNGMKYIGQTINTLKQRKAGGYNKFLQSVINKRPETIEWEVIVAVPEDELDQYERALIFCFNTIHPNGYNFQSGGKNNKVVRKAKQIPKEPKRWWVGRKRILEILKRAKKRPPSPKAWWSI